MSGISKITYENGLRCRGVCNICKDVSECYQAKAQGYIVMDGKVVNKRDLNKNGGDEVKSMT